MIKSKLLLVYCLILAATFAASSQASPLALPAMVTHLLNDLDASVPGYLSVPNSSTTGSYSLSWEIQNTSGDYILEEIAANDETASWQQIYSGTDTERTLTQTVSGDYKYRIKNCDDTNCSDYIESDVISVIVPPAIPAKPVLTENAEGLIVDWTMPEGANSYRVESSFNSGDWQDVTGQKTDISASQFKLTGLASGSWAVRIIACNEICVTSESSLQTTVGVPAQPTAYADGDSLIVDWSFVLGTKPTYYAQASFNGGTWTNITYQFIGATRFAVNDLANGSWSIRMAACLSDCVYSEGSLPVIITDVPPQPTVQVDADALIINWENMPVAGSYTYSVEASLDGGAWTQVQVTSPGDNQFRLADLGPGMWSVRIVACSDSCVYSKASAQVKVEQAPDTPAQPVAVAEGDSLIVDWTLFTAPTIKVEASFNGGEWASITTTFIDKERFSVDNLAGGLWSIRMGACNSICSYSPGSAPVQTGPKTPAQPTAFAQGSSLIVDWTFFNDPLPQVEISLNGGAWTQTSTTFIDKERFEIKDLSAGEWRVRMVACETICSYSTPSIPVQIGPDIPAQPTAFVQGSSLVVDWQPVTASTITIEASLNSGDWVSVNKTDISSSRFEVRNLTAGTWRIRIGACDTVCAYSEPSLAIELGIPAQPSVIPEGDSLLVDWTMIDGFSPSYQVQGRLGDSEWTTMSYTFINSTRFRLANLAEGKWQVRMAACYPECVYSQASETVFLINTLAQPTAVGEGNDLVVNWQPLPTNHLHKVETSFNGGEWVEQSITLSKSESQFRLSQLAAGSWSVRIYGCSIEYGCSYSVPSAPVSIGQAPDVPAQPTAYAQGNALVVDWAAVSAPTIKIEVSLNGSEWQPVLSPVTISPTRFEVRDLAKGQWRVRIAACDTACSYSEPSLPVEITTELSAITIRTQLLGAPVSSN